MAVPRSDDAISTLTGLRSWWSSFGRAAAPREPRSADDVSMFGAPLHEALKHSSVAISLVNQDGKQYVWGYVTVIVAKIGLFLKQNGTCLFLTQQRKSKACSVSTAPKNV